MGSSKLSVHWNFALAVAIFRLEELVWSFDVMKETGDMGYSSVPAPEDLLRIANSFLNEPQYLHNNDQVRLRHIADYLNEHLLKVYLLGQERAHSYWTGVDTNERNSLLAFSVSEVRSEAINELPEDLSLSEQNWFIEGFCRSWWQVEYIAYISRHE